MDEKIKDVIIMIIIWSHFVALERETYAEHDLVFPFGSVTLVTKHGFEICKFFNRKFMNKEREHAATNL